MSFFHNTVCMAFVFGICLLNVADQEQVEVKIDIEPLSVKKMEAMLRRNTNAPPSSFMVPFDSVPPTSRKHDENGFRKTHR